MKAKVTLITVFVLALIILALQTNPAKGQVVTDGLISYWTFDKADIEGDTAKDVWGPNNGTISGAKIAKGLVRDALEFDGAEGPADSAGGEDGETVASLGRECVSQDDGQSAG